MQILNLIEQEDYVASVVESEIGNNTSAEFLKAQSILCRTYALSHLERHADNGYNLCDQVHCQAYKGKGRFNNNIKPAIDSTHNQVLVDANNRLIVAAYHSNCGGMTTSADQVWSKPISYLQPVVDTFCLEGSHANWTMTITIQEWKEYLAKKGLLLQPADSLRLDSVYSFQCFKRSDVFRYGNQLLPMKEIRSDWKLKSSWFGLTVTSDTVSFHGRGFGHGVGLCQEGAMNMARHGYSCYDIINYYYGDVRVLNKGAVELFDLK
jgi:stage II sporulation protein D